MQSQIKELTAYSSAKLPEKDLSLVFGPDPGKQCVSLKEIALLNNVVELDRVDSLPCTVLHNLRLNCRQECTEESLRS